MNLNFETILDFYTFKRKRFLCQIKVSKKSLTYKNTCRCLSQEQWAVFDKKLEKLLTASSILDENGYKFNLNPLIEVKVQKSKLSFKYFYELFDTIGELNKSGGIDVTEKDWVLECLIDFQQEVPLGSSIKTQEYDPKVSISPNTVACSPLPYEPYTPSNKNFEGFKMNVMCSNNNIDYPEFDDDTYCPKPLLEKGVNVAHIATLIPQYTPAPISDRRQCEENKSSIPKEVVDENKSFVKNRHKQYKRMECEYIPQSQDVMIHNPPVYIPTPIEEVTNTIRTFRKRSNTVDALSELVTGNDIEKAIYGVKPKYLLQKSLKKRSMTIDEIPAELLDVPDYIPSSISENTVQRVSKTTELRNNVEKSFSRYMRFNENTKDNQYIDDRMQVMLENDPICNVQNIESATPTIVNSDIITGIENSSAFKNETVLTRFNITQKSKENKPFLTTDEGNLRNSTCTARVFKTAVEKCKPSKTKAVSLSSERKSAAESIERIPEYQKTESSNKPEVYTRREKRTSDKRSHGQASLEQGSKIENQTTQTLKKCRRSERSPSKPKRLIEEQTNSINKTTEPKKHKSLLKNKELFGTDDEDDDDAPHKNIHSNKIFSNLNEISARKDSHSSKKKKHKKDRNSEVRQYSK